MRWLCLIRTMTPCRRQLGYLATRAHSVFSIRRDAAKKAATPIVMGGLKCAGDENSLMTCISDLNSPCLRSSSNSVVGLRCAMTLPTHAQVRLVKRPRALRSNTNDTVVEGRLEIYVGQQWGTVCDRGFDIRSDMLGPLPSATNTYPPICPAIQPPTSPHRCAQRSQGRVPAAGLPRDQNGGILHHGWGRG